MKRWVFTLLIALVLAVVLIVAGYQQISIDALQEPGPLETILATRVKHLLISGAAVTTVSLQHPQTYQ